MEPDIYKIVAINDDGKRVEVYALPAMRRMTQKSMAEDYGNVEVTAMSFDELPEDIAAQVKQSNAAVSDD